MKVHAARRATTCERLGLMGASAFVTLDLPTIEYLTGFTGSNAALLVARDTTVVATDGRYLDQIARQSPDIEVIDSRDAVAGLFDRAAGQHILLDDRAAVSILRRLSEQGITVEPIADPVASVRVMKDASERAAIARACSITAQAVAITAREIVVGETEVAVARRLEAHFGELGAHDRAFATIVGSGPNSAIPHHRAGERRLQEGDLVVIDCGALVDGYHADMTRTFIVGADPEPWQHEIHEVVERAQSAGLSALQVDCAARSVDEAARSVIDDAGFASAFTHGTGHGVGLQIHEAPMLSALSDAAVPANAVVTVEPGIYLPGRGGVRIEDSVLVTDPIKVLTDFPRVLTRVG